MTSLVCRVTSHASAWSFERWAAATGDDPALTRKLHKAIASVGQALDALQFNKAVAALYELTSAIEKALLSAMARAIASSTVSGVLADAVVAFQNRVRSIDASVDVVVVM